MNYLAHYFFNAIQKTGRGGNFHFGVAAPDLFSGYDRRFRFRLRRVEMELSGSANPDLWRGVKDHLVTDAFFHQSRFFKQSYNAVRPILIRAIPLELNIRVFFLAHITVEMLLDHALLKDHPKLANEFYTALNRTDAGAVRAQLEVFFGQKLDGFDRFVNKFMVLRFLESYIDLENVVEAMNRMLTRARQAPVTGQAESKFHDALDEALEVIESYLPTLIGEVDLFQKDP